MAHDDHEQAWKDQDKALGNHSPDEAECQACDIIEAIETRTRAEAAAPDAHDLLMKGAEIGYTYGALGRDFASVLPEIRRLTRDR